MARDDNQPRSSRFVAIADGIDRFFHWTRWPIAVLLVLLILPVASACLSLLTSIVKAPKSIMPFAGGMCLYLMIWTIVFRHWRATWFSSLEHELTHALLAILTFHRVVDIRTTWRSGGHIRYAGRGNWLITLSPYFFPTIGLIVLSLFVFLPTRWTHIADAVLGAAHGFHLTSTIRETHFGQADLKQAGYLFSLMALPGLILVTHGLVRRKSRTGQLSKACLAESGAAFFVTRRRASQIPEALPLSGFWLRRAVLC